MKKGKRSAQFLEKKNPQQNRGDPEPNDEHCQSKWFRFWLKNQTWHPPHLVLHISSTTNRKQITSMRHRIKRRAEPLVGPSTFIDSTDSKSKAPNEWLSPFPPPFKHVLFFCVCVCRFDTQWLGNRPAAAHDAKSKRQGGRKRNK